MIIDIHNHYYPLKYLKAIEKRKTWPILALDEIGRKIIVNKGVRIVTITDEMSNIRKRIEDMNTAGIDMQALTLTTPSVYFAKQKEHIMLAKLANDEISEISEKNPNRFFGLATLPLLDMTAALEEMDRAIKDLGLKGVNVMSNISGKTLDSPEFWPFYERAAKMRVPIQIHPGTPLAGAAVKDFRLGPMVGFPFDTTLAIIRLILSGVLKKYPSLTFLLSHLGGLVPYLVDRIDFCYRAYPECRVNISKPPSEYLKKVYIDTVNFYQPALMCGYAFAGPDRLLLGSDYPHVIGDINRSVTIIKELQIPEEEKEKILGSNAANLFNVK